MATLMLGKVISKHEPKMEKERKVHYLILQQFFVPLILFISTETKPNQINRASLITPLP